MEEIKREATPQHQAMRYLLVLACLVLLIAGLKAASSVFIPVLLAFFIATVSFPITNFLRKHRFPRFLAVLLTVLVDFAFLTGVVLIVVALAGDFKEKWEGNPLNPKDGYAYLFDEKIDEARAFIIDASDKWGGQGVDKDKVNEYFKALVTDQLSGDKVGKFVTGGLNVASQVATFLSTAFIVIVITIFMLTEARMFGRRLTAICEARGPNFQRMMVAARDIQRYMGIKTLVSLVTGLLAGILCWAAGLDFYIFFGMLAFILNYIPVVGSIVAGVPPVILALMVYGGPSAIAVGAGYAGINIFLGNIIEPMLLGRRFGISTLVVVLAVLFWGWIWGPVGMLLAVPLTMILKVVLDNSADLRWLSVAIGKEQAEPDDESFLIKEAAEIKTAQSSQASPTITATEESLPDFPPSTGSAG